MLPAFLSSTDSFLGQSVASWLLFWSFSASFVTVCRLSVAMSSTSVDCLSQWAACLSTVCHNALSLKNIFGSCQNFFSSRHLLFSIPLINASTSNRVCWSRSKSERILFIWLVMHNTLSTDSQKNIFGGHQKYFFLTSFVQHPFDQQ